MHKRKLFINLAQDIIIARNLVWIFQFPQVERKRKKFLSLIDEKKLNIRIRQLYYCYKN